MRRIEAQKIEAHKKVIVKVQRKYFPLFLVFAFHSNAAQTLVLKMACGDWYLNNKLKSTQEVEKVTL